jgi:hypothetical protein
MVGKEIRILRARETTFSLNLVHAIDDYLHYPAAWCSWAAAVCPFLSPSLSLSLSLSGFFLGQFCDIAKVAMMIRKKIWPDLATS